MCLIEISPENKTKEDEIQKKIFSLIDSKKCFIFNSGAGSGKTYALKEALKYIINNYGDKLKIHNQKIVCITYTNVAAQEVKDRLGNSDLVTVSTIHTRIWDIIKRYRRKELVQIHKGKLEKEITESIELLYSEKCKEFCALATTKQERFIELLNEKEELYYSARNLKAEQTRTALQELSVGFESIFSNIYRFRKTADTIYRIERYKKAIKGIEEKNAGYTAVEYTDKYNTDRLHKMEISHDTLLEYGYEIVNNYDVLKRIIVDQYPFIFVDEYQDTNSQVIEILGLLMQYAKSIEHPFSVSFYGDKAQNIYDTGIGGRLFDYKDSFEIVNKPFNRRSSEGIISVINKIRDDEIKQTSIYEDCKCGEVGFFQGSNSIGFINQCKEDWSISGGNKLHCFVLTNESVAKYSGFENIYNSFKNCGRYSTGLGYQQLTTETLNDDLTKLGTAQLQVFKIVQILKHISDKGVSLKETLIDKSVYSNLNFKDMQELIKHLNEIKGDTLNEIIQSLLGIVTDGKASIHYQILINKLFDVVTNNLLDFKQYLINELMGNEEQAEQTGDCVESLLNCSISELTKWANYILREWKGDVIYHTYHGTKGLEFENVAIIMGNAFGRNQPRFFKDLFVNISNHDGNAKARNLLYVACSRAIKNLRILYLDDISSFKENSGSIFGEVKDFYN